MATFLDLSALEAFSKVFVFIIVLIGGYVIFVKSNFLQGHRWLAWVVAFAAGLLVLFSDLVTGLIQHLTPWLAVFFMFVTFIIVASRIMGATSMDVGHYKGIFLVVFILIFIVGSLTYIRGELTAPGDVDNDGDELLDQDYNETVSFLWHPKFMGIIFILLVGIFTVALLAGRVM